MTDVRIHFDAMSASWHASADMRTMLEEATGALANVSGSAVPQDELRRRLEDLHGSWGGGMKSSRATRRTPVPVSRASSRRSRDSTPSSARAWCRRKEARRDRFHRARLRSCTRRHRDARGLSRRTVGGLRRRRRRSVDARRWRRRRLGRPLRHRVPRFHERGLPPAAVGHGRGPRTSRDALRTWTTQLTSFQQRARVLAEEADAAATRIASCENAHATAVEHKDDDDADPDAVSDAALALGSAGAELDQIRAEALGL